jgi:hypothetical protein
MGVKIKPTMLAAQVARRCQASCVDSGLMTS